MEGVYVMNPNNGQNSIKNNNIYGIRAKFMRGEEVKFISHLDIMRTFERALRRSGIPISYSTGFNPQPQIVFGLPLAVGFTSESEYADFQLIEYIDPYTFTKCLNKQLPSGLEILDAKIKDNNENIMATIGAASYIILVYTPLDMGINDIKGKICAFRKEKNIIVAKEGKKRTRNIDIKPMIHKLKIEACQSDICIIEKYNSEKYKYKKYYNKENDSEVCKSESYKIKQHITGDCNKIYKISTLLSAGGTGNLRPELLIAALNLYMKTDFDIKKIHRTALFVKKGEKIVDPLDSKILK